MPSKMLKKIVDRIIAVLIYYFLLMVVIGWLFSFSKISALIPSYFELPLYGAESITSNHKDLIFVNSHYFKRIQMYSLEGKYLGGWYTSQSRNGESYLQYQKIGQIELFTSAGKGESLLFDLEGNLLESNSNNLFYSFRQSGIDPSKTKVSNNVYSVKRKYLFSSIILDKADGSIKPVVNGPWWQYLFPNFLVSWLLILALIIIGKALKWLRD